LHLVSEGLDWEYNPVWSPDSTQIAYYSAGENGAFIYIVNADGTTPRVLTPLASAIPSIAWSPDGKQIAYIGGFAGQQEITLINADGSNPQQLTHNVLQEYNLSWSPDGSYIAFDTFGDQQNPNMSDIYVMDMANPLRITQVTDNATDDYFPVWSPDSQWLAFITVNGNNHEVVLSNVAGN
jgi:Tol biopolymer transport system component